MMKSARQPFHRGNKPVRQSRPLQQVALLALMITARVAAADAPGRTDPAAGLFPDSSIVDFRYLLDKPAGKFGFLTAKNGRFFWANGRRAKFWGVNVSSKSVFTGKAEIDRVVEVFARAGANMVRLEAIDSIGGLTDDPATDTSRKLDARKLQIIDYWTYKLREQGIYYYFDLLDFRQFKPGDEVASADQVGRAAKPYAFFDRRLIELQKEFAQQLLQHVNPLTRLRYVDDPALALVEICNEHGLFFKAASLDNLAEPYHTELVQQWNTWLRQQYAGREGLKAAWGRVGETDTLADSEDPGSYTVRLPLFSSAAPPDPSNPASVVDLRRAPRRLRDGVRFLYETQRGYFREMKTHLRDIGLRVPITAVVSNEITPDVASVAAELDFTSENYYADHPSFAGKEWEGTAFFNNGNPLRGSTVYNVAPWLAALRWENKPVVVREWSTVWPNRYRAMSVPEMAGYCSLHDFDAALLFGYQIAKDPEKLSDFDHQADPTVWGLFGLAAQSFLRGDVHPSPYSATLLYTPDQLYRWPNSLTTLHRAAWFVRLNSAMDTRPASARRPTADSRYKMLASRGSKPAVRRSSANVAVSVGEPIVLAALLAQLQALGAPINPKMMETGVLGTGNGEIVRDTSAGLLKVTTPRTVALCGELPVNRSVELGPFTFASPTVIGGLMAVSLDGRPLTSSSHYVVKMVSRAENTDQTFMPGPAGGPGKYYLSNWGKAPVLTFGRPEGILSLRRGGVPILSMQLTDGTWELLVKNGHATLACDAPGIRGTLFGQPIRTVANSEPITVKLPAARPPAPSVGKK